MSLVLHVPHASAAIPATALDDFVVSGETIEHEKRRLIDHFTDVLFLAGGFDPERAAIAPVCRLVVDVERFHADEQEPASKVGMGAIYTTTTLGEPLRDITAARRQELLDQYYTPHHTRLDRLVEDSVDTTGCCVVLDS